MNDQTSPGAARMARAHQARRDAGNLRRARELWQRGWVAYPAERLEDFAPHLDDHDQVVSAGERMTEHLSQADPCDGCSWCDGYVAALADLLKLHRMALEVE